MPTLFIELHGSEAGTKEQAEALAEIAGGHGGTGFAWATSTEERNALWRARHDAYYAALHLVPGAKGFITDVCVPISRLAECLVETKRDLEGSFLQAPIVGHVGDGNFHVTLLIDPDDVGQIAEARRLNERMVERALALGGTTTGEHGVGYGKIAYVEQEHGPGGRRDEGREGGARPELDPQPGQDLQGALMSERVLVTGALGCVGAWAVKAVLDDGDEPVGYDLGDATHRLELILSPEEARAADARAG